MLPFQWKFHLGLFFSYYRIWQTLWKKRLYHTCFLSWSERSQLRPWVGKMFPWKVREVTIKYHQLWLYSPDCFTRELQPQASEIITDLEEVILTTGPVLKRLTMLLPLLRFSLIFWKRSSLSGYKWLLQINYRVVTIRRHSFNKKI